MGEARDISPFKCRMWAGHDRLEELVTEESCRGEIESFLAQGQLIPVLGRPLSGDPSFEVELIYGARRLFVARHLNVPLRVEVRQVSDREAIVALDIENRHRKDVSPYERGLTYHRWLQSGYFQSQEELAKVLRISASQVCRLLKLARLPAVIVSAFRSPLEIREVWAWELLEAWMDPQRRDGVARRARMLGAQVPQLEAARVFQNLITDSIGQRRVASSLRDEVVTGDDGVPLFRVRYRREGVTLLLQGSNLSAKALRQIKSLLAEILQKSAVKMPGVPPQLSQMKPGRDAAIL